MTSLPPEIQNLIEEYKDSNHIRVRDGKITICTNFNYTESNGTRKDVKVCNGLWTLTVSPMIFTGSQAYRCFLLHDINYDITKLRSISILSEDVLLSRWPILDKMVISTGDGKGMEINIGKPSHTCSGSYDCRCRFNQTEEKEFNDDVCSFCQHNKTQHPIVKKYMSRGLPFINIEGQYITPRICPEIYGDKHCLVLPLCFRGYEFRNITTAFYNLAYKQLRLYYESMVGKQNKHTFPPTFVIPKDRSVRSYFPAVTVVGNYIYIEDDGMAEIKKGQKIVYRANIEREGTAEMKQLYYLLHRLNLISRQNITGFTDLLVLQRRIMDDKRYTANVVISINEDWQSYTF